MKKKIIYSFVILVIIFISTFMWQLSIGNIKPVREPFKITMHLWPGYYHSYIAQEQGYFSDEGVKVELTMIENIDENLKAFVDGEADAVFGSRMLGGHPLEGGMPRWKYVANILLTAIANIVFGRYLSEIHSGFGTHIARYHRPCVNTDAHAHVLYNVRPFIAFAYPFFSKFSQFFLH